MRLISCHIEHFGTLCGEDLSFSSGLTCICRKNGSGKTTLAAFLTAMLYGLPPLRANSKAFCEREHFYPFSGGKFGGNLTLEANGKTYRIERFFDRKSDKKDILTVYCNGHPVSDPEPAFGRVIFGLDEESFRRTVFLDGSDLPVIATEDIGKKLNREVDGTEEEHHYEAALECLEKEAKLLKAARGGNGSLDRIRAEITALEQKIADLQAMDASLAEWYRRRQALTAEIAEQTETLRKVREQALTAQKWNILEGYLQEIRQIQERIAAQKESFPEELPSEEELIEAEGVADSYSSAEAVLEATDMEDRDAAVLQDYEVRFSAGIPEESELKELREKAFQMRTEEQAAAKLEDVLQAERQNATYERFCDETAVREAEKIQEMLMHYRVLNEALEPAAVPVIEPRKRKRHLWIFSAAAAGLFGAGLFFLFHVPAVGGILVGLAALCMITGWYLSQKEHGTSENQRKSGEQNRERETLRAQIRSALVCCGYCSERGIEEDFLQLKRDLEEYRRHQAECGEHEKELRLCRERIQRLKSDISERLVFYGVVVSDGAEGDLALLERDLWNYTNLRKKQADTRMRRAEAEQRMTQLRLNLTGIFAKYRLPEADVRKAIRTLRKMRTEQDSLNRALVQAQSRAEQFRMEQGLTGERPAVLSESLTALQQTLDSDRERLAGIDREIAACEAETEHLGEKQALLLRKKEEFSVGQERYQLLKKTEDFLIQAEQNLKDRYVLPVRERFDFYAAQVFTGPQPRLSLSSDFSLLLEANGERRKAGHLSAGQRCVCGLCLRLALLDRIYPDEVPFLLMDDPFVNLDREHMETAARAVQTLSENRQILYFCCHESRIIPRAEMV